MRLNIYSLIFFIRSYVLGLLVPVLSLVLLEKEVSLSSLSIIMSIYSFIIISFELPSGIMSDVIGRKKTFCISLIISLLSSLVILLGRGFFIMSIGIILYGLNRAISTGSFDALFIDSYIDVFGKNKLHDITTRINVLDALGLAAGSLSGGILPEISNGWSPIFGTYDLNLVVQIVMTIILIILVIIFVNEANLQQKEERISVIEHVKRSSLFIVNSKNVICIFISVFATGYFLSALETYWQPHFISLQTNNDQLFLLGIVAFLYLVAAMAGSLISNKNIDRFNSRKIYLVLRVLMSISIVFTALQTNISSFIVCYIITYLIFGMANIPEAVILNREISNKIRASILSLNSLILQIGMLLGSIANSIMIKYISIPRIWIISAIIIFLSILITSKKLLEADKFSSS